MANTSVIRLAGQTLGLSVSTSAHSAVALVANTTDQANYVSCLNVGTGSVAIRFSTVSTDAATVPGDGTFGDYILPALMSSPLVLACPVINNQNACYVTAKSVSGTNLVYITPLVDQN